MILGANGSIAVLRVVCTCLCLQGGVCTYEHHASCHVGFQPRLCFLVTLHTLHTDASLPHVAGLKVTVTLAHL